FFLPILAGTSSPTTRIWSPSLARVGDAAVVVCGLSLFQSTASSLGRGQKMTPQATTREPSRDQIIQRAFELQLLWAFPPSVAAIHRRMTEQRSRAKALPQSSHLLGQPRT